MVTKHLEDDDIEKSYLGTLDSTTLEPGPGKKYKKSPFTQAAKFIVDRPSLTEHFGHPDFDHIRALCHYWFWADAGDPERMSLADLPRRTKADYGLTDEDYHYMGDLLVTMEWEDSQGNMRQFTGLDEVLLDCRTRATADDSTPEERERAKHRAERLEDIKRRASGLANSSLDSLLEHVCDKRGCEPGLRRYAGRL